MFGYIILTIAGVLMLICVIVAIRDNVDIQNNHNKYELEKSKSDGIYDRDKLNEEQKYNNYVEELNNDIKELCDKHCTYKEIKKNGVTISNMVGVNDNNLSVFDVKRPIPYVSEVIEINNNVYFPVKSKKIKEPSQKGELFNIKSWALENVVFYSLEGNIQYTEKVVGGGSSVSGAIVGGIVGGEAGAIVGSRTPISSRTEEHDDRYTLLKLQNEEIKFPLSMYECLIKLIPEKEYKFLKATQASTIISEKSEKKENNNNSSDLVNDLRAYNELLKEGIISQEEFDAKKKELLNL